MLKRFFTIMIVAIIFIPTFQAFAFTHLKSSNPSNQETVTSELKEITLTFDSNIAKDSYFDLTNSLGEIIKPEIEVTGDQMVGRFTTSLPNDEYTVNWKSISENGQNKVGTFTFSLQSPESTGDTINQGMDGMHQENRPLADPTDEGTNTIHPVLNITPSNALHIVIFILIFIAIVGVSVYFLGFKKK